ncbi:hypothetical protein [Actinoplanes sp. NPDC049802]|uniref:hypothetical protein n=1 Tax=Actinoplanes sp. NPDC049802 TaxID=3154742 RepID=UPI0033C7C800
MSVVVDVCVVMSAPAAAAGWMSGPEFSLAYLEGCEGGVRECRVPLTVGWTAAFETVAPVRDFPSYHGQRRFSGSWWAATTGEFVGFESRLERDRIMLLDYEPGGSQEPMARWIREQQRLPISPHAVEWQRLRKDG